MKTAEEWALEIHSIGCKLPYPYKNYNNLASHLKAIQLDAFKAGMKHAASQIGVNEELPYDCQCCLASQKEAILTTAQQLKEIPR